MKLYIFDTDCDYYGNQIVRFQFGENRKQSMQTHRIPIMLNPCVLKPNKVLKGQGYLYTDRYGKLCQNQVSSFTKTFSSITPIAQAVFKAQLIKVCIESEGKTTKNRALKALNYLYKYDSTDLEKYIIKQVFGEGLKPLLTED